MDYNLYQSKTINDNKKEFVRRSRLVHDLWKVLYGDDNPSSTWSYNSYNLFALATGDELFYGLYKEIRDAVRDFTGSDEPMWMQSWLNYHTTGDLLKTHNHVWDFHGYVSVDPKKTHTVFMDTSIQNKVGQIYVGKGHREHYVEADEPFDGMRITIGFDVHTKPLEMPAGSHFYPLL